jgi:hypothetical protein
MVHHNVLREFGVALNRQGWPENDGSRTYKPSIHRNAELNTRRRISPDQAGHEEKIQEIKRRHACVVVPYASVVSCCDKRINYCGMTAMR